MTLTTPETQPAPPSQRTGAGTLTAIDLFRGLTILEVVTHHTTGMAFRYTTPGTLEHEVLSVLNRTLHFAVPAFMFLSATLLTASLLKRFDARTYFTRRVVRGGWPYLLWSVLYALWYVWTEQRPPEVLTDPAKWTFYLLYGKASYHLYFLLVALEAYFILPLLLPLARRKPGIPLVFLVGLVVQLGLFLLNRHVLKFQFPASTILWYMLPVLLGVGVGANLRTFPDWWRRHWWLLVGLMLLAYAAYLPTSLANLRGEKVDALLYSVKSWLFTSLTALNLLGLSFVWHQSRARMLSGLKLLLTMLGTVSLQVYLIHPAIQQWLERSYPPGSVQPLTQVTLYGYLSLIIPAILASLIRNTRLSTLLFGR